MTAPRKVTLSGSTGHEGIRRYCVNNEFEHLVVRLQVLVQGAAPAPMWAAAANARERSAG
jgi:hypothetical protein